MLWPLKRPAVPVKEIPTWSLYYLTACPTPADPTIIWGSDVPVAGLEAYLRRVNAEADVLISPAHVLVRAVGRCLAEHPEFNRRVLRRRLYDFQSVNVIMPMLGSGRGPEVCLFCDVDRKTVAEIAAEVWKQARELAKGTSEWLRYERLFRSIPRVLRGMAMRHLLLHTNWVNWPAALWGHRQLRAAAMINYLGHRGAPPMRMFKPSRFPVDACTLNVTMGPTESDTQAAPLFVRADHRVVDAYQLGQFVAALRLYLTEPELLDPAPVAAEAAPA